MRRVAHSSALLAWKDASEPGRPFPVTPSIAEIYALDAALDRYAREGPANVWTRHAQTALVARARVARAWPCTVAEARGLVRPDGDCLQST